MLKNPTNPTTDGFRTVFRAILRRCRVFVVGFFVGFVGFFAQKCGGKWFCMNALQAIVGFVGFLRYKSAWEIPVSILGFFRCRVFSGGSKNPTTKPDNGAHIGGILILDTVSSGYFKTDSLRSQNPTNPTTVSLAEIDTGGEGVIIITG